MSLLYVAWKIFARAILSRLITHIAKPSSLKNEFRAGRGTSNMVVLQLRKKYREQNQELYLVFVDLTKVFL